MNSRILGINHATTSKTIESISYAYDQNGLRTAMNRLTQQAALPQAVTAAYDAANELTTFNNPTPNLTYDNNGNLTSDGIKTYTWNPRNQLVAISGGGVTASFVYDVVGRRISKTINGIRTDYQYDGEDIISEIGGGNAINATFIRAHNIDEPLARIISNGVEYYHADALGSIFALTDANGNTTTTYTYDPFGNTTQTGTSSNQIQFSGRESDTGTGLIFFRARYFSPSLQRFLSEDPIGLSSGINTYIYAYNNPLTFSDPLGLKVYTHAELTAIIYNETANLRGGSQLDAADIAIAHIAINRVRNKPQDYEEPKHQIGARHISDDVMNQILSGKGAAVEAYIRAATAAAIALCEEMKGIDPTGGGNLFYMRNLGGGQNVPNWAQNPEEEAIQRFGIFTNSSKTPSFPMVNSWITIDTFYDPTRR